MSESESDKRVHIKIPLPDGVKGFDNETVDALIRVWHLAGALLIAGVPIEELLRRLHSPDKVSP